MASIVIEKFPDSVVLKHTSGSTVKILYYGATVVSWTLANGAENLFLSDAAKLDGSKPVRGGIPLVFPVFGKSSHHPTASLPQHGFARTSKWALTAEKEDSVSFTLSDEDVDEYSRKLWDVQFRLTYTVTLGDKHLKTELEVHNPGVEPFECNTLLHTYLRVPDITDIGIEGLDGVMCIDKIKKLELVEEEKAIKITGPVDRVYESCPQDVKVLSKSKTLFTIERENLIDVVVWNPWTQGAASMADFEPKDAYKNMICVESGNVAGWQTVPVNSTLRGSQIIKSNL